MAPITAMAPIMAMARTWSTCITTITIQVPPVPFTTAKTLQTLKTPTFQWPWLHEHTHMWFGLSFLV
jgi:hypothetical protein